MMSDRRVLSLLLMVAFPVLSLAGCAPDSDSGADTASMDVGPDGVTADVGSGSSIAPGRPIQQMGAIGGAGQVVPPPVVDVTAPSGTVSVNGGAAWATAVSSTLSLPATDDVGVTRVCISNTASCTSWTAYVSTKTWNLTTGAGSKTVHVWYKDAAGNISTETTDSIDLDPTLPVEGTLTATPTDGQVQLDWTGFSDADSGIGNYKVIYSAKSTPPENCSTGVEGYNGPDETATITGLTNGTTYYFRLCAVDVAGNVTPGVTTTSRPAPEYNIPTDGSVVINGDAAYTKDSSVTLTLSAVDDSQVGYVCISNTGTCATWTPYSATRKWSLAGSGTVTVNVWFKDIYGNATVSPVSDIIYLDKIVPTDGTLAGSGSDADVSLSWTAATDAQSGVASYKIMRSATNTPANCKGTAIYTGPDLSYEDTTVTNGVTYNYRVCAVDQAGNISTGKTVTVRPAPEYNPPSGTILIAGGADYAKSNAVMLTLDATDDTSVAKMCISNTTRCTAWTTYATTKRWNMSGAGNSRKVYASFKDAYNNVSTAVFDTILIDKTSPTGGTVSASTHSGSQVDLSIGGFTDSESGVATYKVTYLVGATAPASCAKGSVGYTGDSNTPTVSGLLANTTYSFRACAVDAVGNVAIGVTTSATTAAESDPPINTSVDLAGGADYSTVSFADVALGAEDESGVDMMCLSEDSVCDDVEWIPYDTVATWDFAVDGAHTLYVWFRDGLGNESASPITDTLVVDGTAPVDGVVSASQEGDGVVDLLWTDYSDETSGIDSYRVMHRADGALPTDCDDGVEDYSGPDTSVSINALATNMEYYFLVCAYDVAGNVSAGASTSIVLTDVVSPIAEGLVIDGGADATNNLDLVVEGSASDLGGIDQICISTDSGSCSAWQTYDASLIFGVDPVEGETTLYAWFKDYAGNVSEDYATDSILIDLTAPDEGAASFDAMDASVFVSMVGATDGGSGVSAYRVLYEEGSTPPADCDSGTLFYEGGDDNVIVDGLTNGTTYAFRVCVLDAAGNISSGQEGTARPVPEVDAPVGMLSLNADADYTNDPLVTLVFDVTDDSTISEMCLSLDSGSCSVWEGYADTTTFTLDGSDGSQTVYAWLRDEWGNETSSPISDEIILDQVAPTDGAASFSADDASVIVGMSGESDGLSGIANYIVVYATGSTAPADCNSGTLGYYGSESSLTIDGLTNGTTYAFRMCVEDYAGNISSGETGTARPIPETDAPVASVMLDSDNDYTNSLAVTVDFDATDASTISEMCLSTSSSSCSSWVAYSATTTYTFSGADGAKTLYTWLRDEWGNTMVSPISDDIVLDRVAPTDGSTSFNFTNGGALLDMTGASDDRSGVAGYVAVYAEGTTAPADCNSGTAGYSGAPSSFEVDGLTNGITYAFRVCVQDAAGNLSSGQTGTVHPVAETDAPTGTVVIEGDAAFVPGSSVSLDFSVTDATGVDEMCISTSPSSCSSWVPYTNPANATLDAGEGNRSIYVWLRDPWGNEITTPISDDVDVDETAPSDPVVTVTPDDGSLIVSWTDSTDSSSGLAGYYVVYDEGAAPADCLSGNLAYDGTETLITIDNLNNGTAYGVRVCAYDNATNFSDGGSDSGTPAPEFDGPVGSISIASGATYSGSATMIVDTSATDVSTVSRMCLSADPVTCTEWTDYDVAGAVTVPSVHGTTTVYAWFEDEWGNVSSSPATDTIFLDLQGPTGGTVTATASIDTQATVSWSGFSDANSGLSSYKVVYASGATAPADCSSGTTAYTGASTSTVVTGLVSATTYSFRVCGVDAVGNLGSGATRSVTTPDTTAPTGTMVINSNAVATKTTTVTLTMNPVDAGGVSTMCVSNTTTCTTYVAYAASKSWTLATGTGVKTVYVRFRDAAGNTSSLISDTIIVDTAVPTNGTLTVSNAVAKQMSLTWTGFADASSGIANYKVVYAQSTTAPASCNAGTLLYTGTNLSYTHTGLTTGKAYSYRVCAVDNAGNTSTGATKANIKAL